MVDLVIRRSRQMKLRLSSLEITFKILPVPIREASDIHKLYGDRFPSSF